MPDGCAITAGSVLFEPFAEVVQEAAKVVEKPAPQEDAAPPLKLRAVEGKGSEVALHIEDLAALTGPAGHT